MRRLHIHHDLRHSPQRRRKSMPTRHSIDRLRTAASARTHAAVVLTAAMVLVFVATFATTAVAQAPDSAGDLTLVDEIPDRSTASGGHTIHDDDVAIRRIFGSGDSSRFEAGAEAYLRLITARDLSESETTVVLRHLRSALDVMPLDQQPEEELNRQSLGRVGDKVALWWRRQDPFPSTLRNERLEEHLSRWAFALDEFPNTSDEDVRGFDDRGRIYLRFGSPGKQIRLRIDRSRHAHGFSNSLIIPELPESEMWVYRHVHDEAYYFFARDTRRAPFRITHPSETIPSRLSAGLDYRNRRGRHKADVLLLVMEEVYGQLALAHPIFGSIYDEVVRFRISTHSDVRPSSFARSALAAASTVETESAGRRGDIVPASFSNTKGMTEDLPLETRWARFLEPDGSTRTEIYWSLDRDALGPSGRLQRTLVDQGHTPTDRYLVAVSVAQQSPDYQTRDVHTKHYMVESALENAVQAQVFTVRGDTGQYNLAAEWSQHWTLETDEGQIREGAMLKLETIKLDSLEALHSRGEELEMSDLKPVFPTNPDAPYPLQRMDRSSPPNLYFELYNLHYGPDDQTKYTIEYEVRRATEEGRASEATSTRARTTFSGSDRIAREQIGLDLSEWREAGEVQITVRATDEVTSEQVTRSVTFALDP